jgi:hypothetical protein
MDARPRSAERRAIRDFSQLGNYPFLTSCVETREANLYEVSCEQYLSRFSNTAAVEVCWDVGTPPSERSANADTNATGPETGFGEVSDRSSDRFVGNAEVGFLASWLSRRSKSNSIGQSVKLSSIYCRLCEAVTL